MADNIITCTECEAEFEITHDTVNEPEYCPFCSSKLVKTEKFENEDDWDDQDRDRF